jgi:hypothetical protein
MVKQITLDLAYRRSTRNTSSFCMLSAQTTRLFILIEIWDIPTMLLAHLYWFQEIIQAAGN